MSLTLNMRCKSFTVFSLCLICRGILDSVANDESKLYIHTNEGAPNYKLSTLDLADPKGERKDLIPERDDAYLYDVTAVGRNYFAVVYKRNVRFHSSAFPRLCAYGCD